MDDAINLPSGSADGVCLSTLSSHEVEILELLREGHTVKSIAQLTGRSPAWINERLRDARGKTGVGSSRELARLLGAGESDAKKFGPKKIGLVPASPVEPAAEAPSWWRRHWAIPIGGLTMTVLLAAALLWLAGAEQEFPARPAAGQPSSDVTLADGTRQRERYLVGVSIIQPDRPARRMRLLVQEREMVRTSIGEGIEANMVVMPSARGSSSVDVALWLNIMESPDPQTRTRRSITSTVTVDKEGSFRVELSQPGGERRGFIEIAVSTAPDEG